MNSLTSNTIEVIRKDGEVILSVVGNFTFDLHLTFKRATDPLKAHQDNVKLYTVDFARTGRVDSSALGMLMIFFGEMGGDRNKMRIINASPSHRQILDVALFEEWFRIE